MPVHRLKVLVLLLASVGVAGCSASSSSFGQASTQVSNSRQMSGQARELPPGQMSVPSVILPGFGRNMLPPVHATSQRSAKPLQHGAVYTAQYYGNDSKIYSKDGTNIAYVATLGGFVNPQGIATTRADGPSLSSVSGQWYIANTGASNVPIYESTAKGPIGPVETLQDSGQYPVDVDASNRFELVAVSNYSTTNDGPGSVSVYAGGSQTPTSILQVAGSASGVGIVIDHHGNCFWSYNTSSSGGGVIVSFHNCAGAPHTIVTGIGFAGGLTVDGADNLYYVDQTAGLFKCAGSTSCALLSNAFTDPLFTNFDSKWHDLWVTDSVGYIDAVDPSTGAILSSTAAFGGASDPPVGVAPAPAARY